MVVVSGFKSNIGQYIIYKHKNPTAGTMRGNKRSFKSRYEKMN